MALLIIANLLAVVSLTIACPTTQLSAGKQLTGTCASINYTTTCCHSQTDGEDCKASDGNCWCDAKCHSILFNNCCGDACLHPTTCQEYGISECCNSSDTGVDCRVYLYDNHAGNAGETCSCDRFSCGSDHKYSCCAGSDVICPITCSEANISANCTWRDPTSCYVKAGNCYCDYLGCSHEDRNDCCSDIKLMDDQNLIDCQIMQSSINLPPKQEQESNDSDDFDQLLKSLAQDTDMLNKYVQYAYAQGARLLKIRSQT